MMNKSTSQRSEEARRKAQAELIEAKEQQNALLQERAAMFAVEAQKVENLRALRLAKEATTKSVAPHDSTKPPLRRKKLAA